MATGVIDKPNVVGYFTSPTFANGMQVHRTGHPWQQFHASHCSKLPSEYSPGKPARLRPAVLLLRGAKAAILAHCAPAAGLVGAMRSRAKR